MYECHITCLPRLGNQKIAEDIASALHWKTSQIARDPILGDDTYFYLTTHGTDYIHVYDRMKSAVEALEYSGMNVLRQKIELIMYDTRQAGS